MDAHTLKEMLAAELESSDDLEPMPNALKVSDYTEWMISRPTVEAAIAQARGLRVTERRDWGMSAHETEGVAPENVANTALVIRLPSLAFRRQRTDRGDVLRKELLRQLRHFDLVLQPLDRKGS